MTNVTAAKTASRTDAKSTKPEIGATTKTIDGIRIEGAETPKPCLCGCTAPTKTPTAMYLPGHDARHAGTVARSVLASGKTSELAKLPTPALKAKAAALVEAWTDKAEAKSAKAAERDAAKEKKALEAAEAKTLKEQAASAKKTEKLAAAAK